MRIDLSEKFMVIVFNVYTFDIVHILKTFLRKLYF